MIYSNSSSIFSTLCCFCCCFWFFALFCFVQVVQPLPKIDCNVGLVNYAYTRIQRICSIRVLFIILTLLFFIYKIIFDFLKLFFFFQTAFKSFFFLDHWTSYQIFRFVCNVEADFIQSRFGWSFKIWLPFKCPPGKVVKSDHFWFLKVFWELIKEWNE